MNSYLDNELMMLCSRVSATLMLVFRSLIPLDLCPRPPSLPLPLHPSLLHRTSSCHRPVSTCERNPEERSREGEKEGEKGVIGKEGKS